MITKIKSNHLAILFLLVALVVDHAFFSYSRQLSQGFQMSLVATLMQLRPAFLVPFYLVFFFAFNRTPEKISPYLLIVIVVVLWYAAFSTMNFPGFRMPEQIRQVFTSAASSNMVLTLHTGGLILALGIFRRMTSRK